MNIRASFAAGVFAALAGACGKVGFSPLEGQISLLHRALCVALMLGFNSMMLKFMVKSFCLLGAAKATVVNLGFNYLASAAVGLILFSEGVSMNWCLGAATILAGIYIINSDN